jgi:hypothetical protein
MEEEYEKPLYGLLMFFGGVMLFAATRALVRGTPLSGSRRGSYITVPWMIAVMAFLGLIIFVGSIFGLCRNKN